VAGAAATGTATGARGTRAAPFMLAQVTDDSAARPRGCAPRGNRPRRELAVVLLLGAAGAGLVFLAMRQGWAQVHTAAPKPLPPGVVTETGQDLVPAADALAVAALASLAAVIATRRVLRRLTGVLLAGFGVSIAVAVGTSISAASVLAAAAGGSGPGSGSGAGAAGSVTAGAAPGGAAPGAGVPVTGLPGHVVFAAFPWHVIALAGAAAVVAAGVLVAWRAERMPVMSSRFDPPAPAGAPSARAGAPSARAGAGQRARAAGDAATIWESLSRGDDPTAG